MNGPEMISVIVPCYNIAPYIESCVHSILNQTYSNLEILLVDDGSTDGTAAVLDRLAAEDEKVHVIHQENGGVTRARLTGVAAANGEWIGFVDGDDMIEPDMYERLLANAHTYGADISHCGYQMVFPSHVDYYYNTGRLIRQDQRAGLKDLLDGSFIEPGLCNKLFRKSLLQSLFHSEVMDFTVKNTEDLLMNYYLFRQAKSAVYEDFCPYHYMVRENSAATSKLNEQKLRDPLRVLKRIKEDCKDDPVLLRAVNARIAGCLIGLATMPLGDQAELIAPHRSSARRELRALVPELLRGDYSRRTKLLSAWAAAAPASYAAVHKLYARARGTDKKYEVR